MKKKNFRLGLESGQNFYPVSSGEALIRSVCSIGSAALQENYGKMPISMLSGDFSINFASDDSVLLVDFLREKLNLTMNNDPNEQQQGQGMERLSMPSSKDALINQNRCHFQLISAITNQLFYF